MRANRRGVGTTVALRSNATALSVSLFALALAVALALLLGYGFFRGEGRPELALATDPISLYVVNDGEVEERRSGVSPAWSPDGKRVAYKGDFDGNVWIDDRAFPLGVGIEGNLQWTPDGRSLLFEGNGIRLLDVTTGRDRLVAPGTSPALSPDGRTVAYLRYTRSKLTRQLRGSRLELVPLAGGQPRVVAQTQGGEYGPHFQSRPQWLPDGTAVTILRRLTGRGSYAVEQVGLDGSRRVVAPRTGPEFALSPDGRLIAYPHWSPSRQALVVARPGDESGQVYEVGRLLPERYSRWMLTEYGGLAWSPDGQEIAFSIGGEDISSLAPDALLRVYALDVTSGELRRLAEIRDAARAQLAWNPHP
jgi:dipeptidyl aminopeptidase/acylaminoacyl peptidase